MLSLKLEAMSKITCHQVAKTTLHKARIRIYGNGMKLKEISRNNQGFISYIIILFLLIMTLFGKWQASSYSFI